MKKTAKKIRIRKPLPYLERSEGRTRLIVDGKPFVALGGEVQNSSGSDVAHMNTVWPQLAAQNYNTVLVSVSWELIEPREGHFDFQTVRGLVEGAHKNGLRLILLWFGTWKNGQSTYTPAWVKQDVARFQRGQTNPGNNSQTISTFCEAACQADARAFSRLMRWLRENDQARTVIMVQVENEVGFLGSSRDRCAVAEKKFAEQVPAELLKKLAAVEGSLYPDLREAWAFAGRRSKGTWAEAFGSMADEVFMAWHIANYVERVAAAGKAEYALPLFANAWLNYGEAGTFSGGAQPGGYPSGGPVTRVHDIWRIAAPTIEALAPDIYSTAFKPICQDFVRNGNPLIIPECFTTTAAAYSFWAVGQHGALCFAPFGVDRTHPFGPCFPDQAPGLTESYGMLNDLMPIMAPHLGTDRIRGILQTVDKAEKIQFDGFELEISYESPLKADVTQAYGLIVKTGELEYFMAGRGFGVRFNPPAGAPWQVDILSVDDGVMRGQKWVPGRRLNGDDTTGKTVRLTYEPLPVLRHVKLYRHP